MVLAIMPIIINTMIVVVAVSGAGFNTHRDTCHTCITYPVPIQTFQEVHSYTFAIRRSLTRTH